MPIYFSWFITALLSVSVVRTITTYRTVGAFLYCVNMASRVENRRSDCSLPVDIRRGFRRATSVRSPMRTCHRHYPGRFHGACSLVSLHRLRPSLGKSQVGSCNCCLGVAPPHRHG